MRYIRSTLGIKLLSLYIILFTGCFVFIHTFGTSYIESQVIEESTDMLQAAGNAILTHHIENQTYTDDTIKNFRSHILVGAETSNCRILIINVDGDLLLDTDNVNVNDNVYKYDSSFLTEHSSVNITTGNLIRNPSLLVNIPIQNSVLLHGYLVLVTPMSQVETRTTYYFNILDGLFYIIMVLLAIIFVLLYVTNTLPLRRLIQAAKEFSIRRDNPPITIKTNDEYRDLAETLNILGDEMSKFDDYQKKFIANISHDFRSPLTSIKGYAEALIDGTIPFDSKDKYLNIIVSETDRLNRLTSNLLELGTLDSDQMMLEYSKFDVQELIQKTVDSMEVVAAKKNVVFQLFFTKVPKVVYADRAKIAQVIQNLMDNAIKFSHPDSTIDISTKRKGEKIFVSVKDYGQGISKDSVKKVFERFYKQDTSRGKDKKGTGLGLSICREIINAHGQTIDVVSTEGVGSEFVFTLQRG